MPTIDLLDSSLYYEECGDGSPIVLLHGNPGSSHLWRNVIPGLGPRRLLAPDLIGMGRSGKPEGIAYSFADHVRYLDAWFDALELNRVILVGHDWGGALAFDWAARHPRRVAGVAFFESVVKPMAWDELSPQARRRWETVRSPGAGEKMVLEDNLFLLGAFTRGGVLTPVGDADMQVYLEPFPTPESRRPILAWARQLPLGGEPPEIVSRIENYDAWLAASAEIPKLLITFEGSPSLLIDERMTQWCATNIASLQIVTGGRAGHHAPEDRPGEIAAAIGSWLDQQGLR